MTHREAHAGSAPLTRITGSQGSRRPGLAHRLLRWYAPALVCLLAPLTAQALECNTAAAKPVTFVEVPGEPFTAIASADGCWIYVSLTSGTSQTGAGLALFSRRRGGVNLERTVALRGSPTGMALTHDGRLLVIASGLNVAFVDVERLTGAAENAVLGNWGTSAQLAGRNYATISADDHYLFVTDELAGNVSILDLAQARAFGFSGHSQLHTVAVGTRPMGVALSSDQRYLLVVSQMMDGPGAERRCRGEDTAHGEAAHVEGAITVIDILRALTDSGSAVVKTVRAGCNPVRVTTSPERGRVYVTARGSNSLLVFDEKQLTTPQAQDRPVRVSVGNAPIDVHLVDHGRKVLVANSDRWASEGHAVQSISVIDTATIGASAGPVVSSIPVQGFPREIRTTADGNTLLVTNFSARALEVVDLTRGPWSISSARPRRPRVY